MSTSRRRIAILIGVVLPGCATSDGGEAMQSQDTVAVAAEQAPEETTVVTDERRVTFEQLSDPTTDLDLTEYTGVDLETASPPASVAFCDAVAGAPSRWLNDALIPLQFWVDSYRGVGDPPPMAAEAVEALLAFGGQRIDWNLGRAERPLFDVKLAAHAKTVADVAVVMCPDLPPVLGRSDEFLADPWGGAVDGGEVASRCAADRAEIEAAIVRYAELFATMPLHLEQIETGLLVHDEYFFGSDLHGVSLDESDRSVPVAVIGGPCADAE